MSLSTIVISIFVFGSIILVHELGHLLFAKKYGVYCYEFSVGMGPKLFSKKYGETSYSIRAIPFGGFVSMAGEDDEGKGVPEGRRLNDISKLKQAMVMFAGAFFNFIFTLVLLFMFNIIIGQPVYNNTVGGVSEGSDADVVYNLEPGYEVIQINGVSPSNYEDTYLEVQDAKATGSLNIVFEKGDQTIVVQEENIDENYVLGFNYEVESTSRNIFTIVKNTFVMFISTMTIMVTAFYNLIVQFSELKDSVGGPILIADAIGQSAEVGFSSLLYMTALLSANIGILNLLPIPGLDGSKIVIAIGEHITKRELPRKLYMGLSAVGIMFLFTLMIFITIKDIINLF